MDVDDSEAPPSVGGAKGPVVADAMGGLLGVLGSCSQVFAGWGGAHIHLQG